MSFISCGLIAVGLSFGVSVQQARASDNSDKREASSGGGAAALVETRPGCDRREGNELSKKEAKAVFKQGREAFEAGDYQSAITHWKQSYAGDCTAHALLYNIALAYEHLDDAVQAVAFHRAYLDRQKDAADREQVLQRIKGLEKQIVEEDGGKSPTSERNAAESTGKRAATERTSTQPGARSSGLVSSKPADALSVSTTNDGASHAVPIAPWVLVGVGGAVMVAGGVFLGLGAKAVSDADAKCPNRECEAGTKDAREGNNGRTMMAIGGVGLGAGALAIAGGLTWHFVEKSSSSGSKSHGRREGAMVFPAVGDGFAGFGVRGSL